MSSRKIVSCTCLSLTGSVQVTIQDGEDSDEDDEVHLDDDDDEEAAAGDDVWRERSKNAKSIRQQDHPPGPAPLDHGRLLKTQNQQHLHFTQRSKLR